LLVKTGSFSRPVRRAANVALDSVVCSVELAHAVTALCVHGVEYDYQLHKIKISTPKGIARGRVTLICPLLIVINKVDISVNINRALRSLRSVLISSLPDCNGGMFLS
jgi:hypothetical protein